MTRKRLGVLALLVSTVVVFALPAFSLGKAVNLREARDALEQAGQQVKSDLKATVEKTGQKTAGVIEKTKGAVKKTKSTVAQKAEKAKARAVTNDPLHQPPLHGANAHGQGNVAIVDIDPSRERPLDRSTDGSASREEAIVGRARGEKDANGTMHGHITTAALFGRELLGVDTAPGESKSGPLQGLQTQVLDQICTGTGGPPPTGQGLCLSVLTSNSATTATGSTNDFAVARAAVLGLSAEAATAQGTITDDAKTGCETSQGVSKTANVQTSSGTIAKVANSSSRSKSCPGAAPEVINTSQVIDLGGTGVALPAAGCENGTPDTDAGLPGLLPIVCNAEDIAGAAAVREALDVYALQTGANALLKETTASSESVSSAERGAVQCSDGVDNDGDGVADAADPGCHTDNDAKNPASYDPNDNDETDAKPSGAGGPGGGGEGPAGPSGEDEGEGEGAGGGGGGGAQELDEGALPFTGTDVLGVALAGLLMLAGGLMLRRREDVRTVR